MIPYKQLSLADIFSDCQEKFGNGKPAFLSLLELHIGMDEIILITFYNNFYTSTSKTCKYPLVNPKTFLGDVAFGTARFYKYLHDPSLPMKPQSSKSNLWSAIPAFKFICPKM